MKIEKINLQGSMSDAENIIKIHKEISSKLRKVLKDLGKYYKDKAVDDEIVLIACYKAFKNIFESSCIVIIEQMTDRQIGLNHILCEVDELKSNIEREIQVK